ncbi:MAG TPA: D-glycerate dehydrogenase [Chitinophagaceae bacterium]|nr:D-glycerate dehydrogenase [Chitinophagaceae bacterium]
MKRKFDEIKVLVTRNIPVLGVEMLRNEGFSVTAWPHERPMTDQELITESKKHNVILCVSADNIGTDFLKACPHLEMISQFAVGYDNIDIPLATKLGIPIGYAPGAMNEATADIAFGLMIAVARKFFYMHKGILKGEWTYFKPNANLGFEFNNKTLGIFGLGRIGMAMAGRCKGAYNMNIIYCNRKANPEAEKLYGVRQVSFDQLLQQSDVISVHSALNKETKEIFNKDAFNKMKSSSIFINTARGGVHNEQDLIDALKKGTIWGAGLDVTNPEPMKPDNPLLEMENVCVLPHIGSATIEARNEMSRMAAENIISYFKNNSVPNIVNPEVLKK